ncbi:MAG: UDP-N-acetylmuramoyl-L-alanyl-D-glutamate--2,6-diaminopimelate ligase [Gammaproteobacteria bacterium]
MEYGTLKSDRRSLVGWPLSQLLGDSVRIRPGDERMITGLASDSRAVVPGDLYFARRGRSHDGCAFIDAACAGGAVVVVAESGAALPTPIHAHNVPILFVADLPACIGRVAHRFFGEAGRALQVIGVTGTNGKTSVTYHVAQAIHQWSSEASRIAPCGLIGTLGYGLFGQLEPSPHTTPDAITLHRVLAEMQQRQARVAVMEVSSHALEQQRVAAVTFDIAVFTNLSRDHLDFHGTMAAYGATKRRLFEIPGLRFAVLNVDDPFGRRLFEGLPASVEAVPYSLNLSDRRAAIRGRVIANGAEGLAIAVETPWGGGEVETTLLGRFNASNLLAVLAVLLASGIPLDVALARMGQLTPVPGRMQRCAGTGTQPLVVVDYAHSPAALTAVLDALREQCSGALWCVVGCGGDRDRGKRPLMGAAVAREADVVVLTDDNPRSEEGQCIIDEILQGIPERSAVIVERDREQAIRYAVQTAQPTDVVLVAGKGHEHYQEISGVRRPFSDAAVVRSALRERR